MKSLNIFLPCAAMVLLTMVVLIGLLFERISQLRLYGLSIQTLATRVEADEALTRRQVADHFKNLFETPVLFYVVCVMLFVTNYVPTFLVYSAWGFVGLRVIHAYIHCTYNNVVHRVVAFGLSCLVLFGMWICFLMYLYRMILGLNCFGCGFN